MRSRRSSFFPSSADCRFPRKRSGSTNTWSANCARTRGTRTKTYSGYLSTPKNSSCGNERSFNRLFVRRSLMRLHFVGWLVTLSAAAALLTLVTYAYPQVIETKEEKKYDRIELRGTLAKAPVKVVFHDNGRPITPNTEKTETWELTVKSMVLPVRFTGKELRGLVNRHAGQEVIVSAAASFRSVMIPSELPQRWGGIEPPPQAGLAAYFYAESL